MYESNDTCTTSMKYTPCCFEDNNIHQLTVIAMFPGYNRKIKYYNTNNLYVLQEDTVL